MREISALKRLFSYALKSRKISTAPYIPTIPLDNARRVFFTHEEFEKLLTVLPSYLKPICTLAFNIGWRLRELTGLKWEENVDLLNAEIRIAGNQTKNKEAKVAPLSPKLLGLLTSLKIATPTAEYVFTHANNKPLIDFRWAFNKACEKAGLDHKIFHDFKRSGTRNLVRAGNSPQVVMEIVGNKSPQIFARYNITSQDDKREAMLKLEEYNEKNKHRTDTVDTIDHSNTIEAEQSIDIINKSN